MTREHQTILITLGDSFVARNLFATSFLEHLTMTLPGVSIVVVTKEGTAEQYRPLIEGFAHISLREVAVTALSKKERMLVSIARTCFRSGTLRTMQHRASSAGESRIPSWVKQAFAFLFGGSRLVRTYIRTIDTGIEAPLPIAKLLEDVQPTLVFTTLLMDDQLDIPLLREAKRRGVHTVGMVRGWDNLTTYGFLRQLPDLFLAQDQFLKEMAIVRHDMKSEAIQVTGFPHYDLYLDTALEQSREEFFHACGVDPAKRIVLYAAVGDFLLPGERKFMDVFELIAEQHPEQQLHFIYRGHPVLANGEQTEPYEHVSFDSPRRYAGTRIYKRDEIRADFAHIINLFRHADVIATTGSTVLLDAAAFNKACIAMGFDPQHAGYWFSCLRFLDTFDHVKAVLTTGHLPVARSAEDLAKLVARAHSGGEDLAALRARFVEPLDGKAASRVAEALGKALPEALLLAPR